MKPAQHLLRLVQHPRLSTGLSGPSPLPWRTQARRSLRQACANPAVLIFVCYNLVNLGNLVFNMLFSRWMGPALYSDLAVVLAVKLALLSVFVAVQMAVSREVATHHGHNDALLARFHTRALILLTACLPIVIGALLLFDIGQRLGMTHPHLLVLVLLALPIALPLCLLRGVVQGRMDVTGVMLSVGIEMGVRLVGAILMWQLGAGIEGVTLAIVVSVVAGWAVITPRLPRAPKACTKRPCPAPSATKPNSLKPILLACLPFAVLQLSQVALLDAEVFAAKLMFSAADAGYLAATSLFQRIEFYACFGLASVLLPSVAAAVAKGGSGLRQAAPIAALFLVVTACVFTAIGFFPDTLIRVLVGSDYLPALELLPLAALSAAAFTLSFLIATFLAGQGSVTGIWLIAACVPIQLGAFQLAATYMPDFQAVDLLTIKVICQSILALCIFLLALTRSSQGRQGNPARRAHCSIQGDSTHEPS